MRTAAALAIMTALAACASPEPAARCTLQEPAAASALADLRAIAAERGAVRVIARMAVDPAMAEPALAEARETALAAFTEAGVVQAAALSDRLPYVVAEVTAAQLDALYANPQFDAWTEDKLAFPTLAQSGPLVQAPDVFALGARGQGQAVAILDTGVDNAHSFLAPRVVAEACFSTTSAAQGSRSVCPNGQASQIGAGAARPCGAAGCEHGTHVAGIAAGRGQQFSGIAPDADIIAVQVFSQFTGAACGNQGSPCVASFTSDQIRGLDFVLQLAAQRAVASANMSLGGDLTTTFCDDDLTKPVIDQLRAAGVATAIAAGNDGSRTQVSFPGCISTAVTVGSTTKQDAVSDFSNCGPQVDLLAPGSSINSSIPGNRFASFSGTSMATPHVAGAFALLRSLRPQASVDEIERALVSTGRTVSGRPRIQLLEAARSLQPAAPAEGSAAAEPAAADGLQTAVAQLATLPPDQTVRMIVRANVAQGAQGQAVASAVAAAQTAARAAGITHVEPMAGQPMLVIEATPAQARALAQSGAISAMQPDRVARTQ
jgi:subtilisin family serine protease